MEDLWEKRLLFIKNCGYCGMKFHFNILLILDNCSRAAGNEILQFELQSETKWKQDQDFLVVCGMCGFLCVCWCCIFFSQILLKFLWPTLLWCIFSACQLWWFRIVMFHDCTSIAVKLACSLLMWRFYCRILKDSELTKMMEKSMKFIHW